MAPASDAVHAGFPPAPRERPRDPALDGLRGVAVLLVFLFHYGGGLRAANPALRLAGYVTQAGWVGVELFLALSGYLITAQLLPAQIAQGTKHRREPHPLRNFYLRRALRILPLYFAALVASAAAAIWNGASMPQLRPLLVYAGFLQNVPPFLDLARRTPPPLPVYHLWTLALEAQFYLLWPLLLLVVKRRRVGIALSLAVFALGCLLRGAIFTNAALAASLAPQAAVLFPARTGALALGSALAFALPALRTRQLRSIALSVAVLSGLAWLSLGYGSGTFLLQGKIAFSYTLPVVDLLAAAVLTLCLQPGRLRFALAWRPLRNLGRISYGFYVLHLLCQPLFDRLGTLLTHQTRGFAYQGARFAVALPLSTLLAELSFFLLERPFLRLKAKLPFQDPPTPESLGPRASGAPAIP